MAFMNIHRYLTHYLQGMAVGLAEIIPGVSGSTVALLLGIYDDFIDLLYQGTQLVKVGAQYAIGQKKWKDLKKQWQAIQFEFGILLGLGMVTSVLLFSSIIVYLLFTFPHYTFAFLLGLTPPTMVIVYKQVKKMTMKNFLIAAGTAILFLSIFIFGGNSQAITNPHPLHLFVGGMVAISAMVLPGVSGSFMLLVVGLYNFVIGLVASAKNGLTGQEMVSLGFLLSGIVVGLFTTSQVLKWAFEKIRSELMSFLLGLLAASWYVLWPFVTITGIEHDEPVLGKVSPTFFPPITTILIILIALVTATSVYLMHRWADRQDTESPKADSGFDKL